MPKGSRKPSPSSSSSSNSSSQESSASSASSSSHREKRKGGASKSKRKRSSETGNKDRRRSRSRKGHDKTRNRGTEQSGQPSGFYSANSAQGYVNGSTMPFGGYQGSGWPAGAPPGFPHGLPPGGPPPPRPLPPGHLPPPHMLNSGPPPPRPLPPGVPPGAGFPGPPAFGQALPFAGDDHRRESRAGSSKSSTRPSDDRSRDTGFGSFGGRDRGRDKRDKPMWVPGQGRNPDLEAERKTGMGLGSQFSEHDDRRGEAEVKRQRAPSPFGSWKHDMFDEVMKGETKDTKAKKRR